MFFSFLHPLFQSPYYYLNSYVIIEEDSSLVCIFSLLPLCSLFYYFILILLSSFSLPIRSSHSAPSVLLVSQQIIVSPSFSSVPSIHLTLLYVVSFRHRVYSTIGISIRNVSRSHHSRFDISLPLFPSSLHLSSFILISVSHSFSSCL